MTEPVQSGSETLWGLRAKLLDRVLAQGHSPGAPQGSEDDFDMVCRYLRELLVQRDSDLGKRLTEENLANLASEIVDIMNAQSVSGDGHPKPVIPRLTHYEAAQLRMAERKIDRLIGAWQGKRNKLENRAKAEQQALFELKAKAINLHARHRDEKELREPHRHLSTWFYIVLMVALCACEVPINMEAFAILNEGVLSDAVAVGVSVALVALAHASGMILRQLLGGHSKLMDLLFLATGIVSMLTGVAAVAALRATWFAYSSANRELTSDEVIWITAALAGVNALFLSFGTAMSYLNHDPDRELEILYSQKIRVRRELRKHWRRYGKWAAEFDALRGQTLARIDEVRHHTRALFSEYRMYNSRPGRRPTSFGEASDVNRLFKPRDLGAEIDLTPIAIDTLLVQLEETK